MDYETKELLLLERTLIFEIKILIPFLGDTQYTVVDGLNAVKYEKSRLEYEACDSKYVDLRVQGSQNSGVQESKDLKAQGFHNNPS